MKYGKKIKPPPTANSKPPGGEHVPRDRITGNDRFRVPDGFNDSCGIPTERNK